ncbi:MAG: hypothetical protein ACO1NU_06095 [Arcticibacter sp.]
MNNHTALKLWGMPLLIAVITFAGLISAILGTGMWHYMSWVALSYPVYIMIKYGRRFFS